MNIRSLIFLVCTAITFFIVQYFFDTKRQKDLSAWIEQKKTEAVQILKKEEKETQLSLKDLNEVIFYQDSTLNTIFSIGTKIQESFLLYANKEYPKNLYINIKGQPQEVSLFSTSEKNSPALYAHTTPKINLSSYSNQQLFYLLCTNCSSKQKLSYAKIAGSRVFLYPEVEGNALVFIKKDQRFVPVAVYDFKTQKIRSLDKYFSLKKFIVKKELAQQEKTFNEDFYVIENEYQQLVFSTRGGSLAEINLTLKENVKDKSLVKPIKFDRIMAADYPENDFFPQNPYFIMKNGSKTKIEKGKLAGYYPLIRRSIYNKNGQISKKIMPKYYAYNILSDVDNLENLNYTVTRFEENLIEFQTMQPFRKITKTFSFTKEKAPYCLDLNITIQGDSSDLYLSSGIPEVELISSRFHPALKYRYTQMEKSKVSSLKIPTDSTYEQDVYPDWICNSNGFLGLILDPLNDDKQGFLAKKIEGTLVPTRLSVIDARHNLYPANNFPGYLMGFKLSEGSHHFRLFSGPFQDSLLTRLDQIFSIPKDNYNPDYKSAISIHGWFSFISEPFGKFLFFLMQIFHKITSSWGISIILLTIALRLMLYPLNSWAINANKRFQELSPKIKEIQEKYKKDPKRLQAEMMKIYRTKGGSPLAGCIPMLIQLPFLLGMFEVLKSTFELRGASFIPGWINNLAAPDSLFSWGYPLPILGTEFHLLPLLVGISMYLSQKLTTKQSNTKIAKSAEQEKQQKIMGMILPIMMVFFFYNLPSGLNIYFLSSTILGIVQQQFMTRK